MEAITHWAGNIVSYLVFLTVLTGLLPAHKYEKYIRLFAGCILLLIVLKPLTDGLRLEERLNYLFTSLSFENEAGELKREMDEIEVRRRNMVLSQYEAEASKEAVRVAAEAGFSVEKADVELEKDPESEQFASVRSVTVYVAGSEAGMEAAEREDPSSMIGGINEKIPRGSFMFSIEKLCDRWGWSRNRVKRFLALLEREQMIETKRTNKGTLISVLNYNAFQSVEEVTEKETEISDAHETAKKVARFIPPTVDEVQAYCEERKNGVDARCFVDFYESKNWVVGKAKMKNWKAAVRTWERNRRDKVTRNTVNANNSSQLQYLLESME